MILSSQESEERFRGAATIAKDFWMKLTKREIKVVKKQWIELVCEEGVGVMGLYK